MDKVVLDTNIFFVSISSKSKFHWIFSNLINGKYILYVTTDILAEIAEIIGSNMGKLASENALMVLENLPNVQLVTTYFKFGLLKDDDDNKFVDCAIAGNASFIVTHDKDFNLLKNLSFPKLSVINIE